jgi:hypothetical protein
MRRSPWDQAGDATFTLLEILTRLSDDDGWLFAFAVVTTDQTQDADRGRVSHQHIGSEQMTPAGLERSLDELARLAGPLPNDHDHPRRLDSRPMENLSMVFTDLRREVDAMHTPLNTESSSTENLEPAPIEIPPG